MTFTPDQQLIQEHCHWLSAFDAQHLRNWQKLLNADAEAAMCEAAVRGLLEENGNQVEPNEDLTGSNQSPDFRCTQAGKTFFVEVTCLSIDKVTEVTALPHLPPKESRASHFGLLNDAFFNACRQKTPQCARLGHPALVAVGTFHFQASCLCFLQGHLEQLLTGQELITFNIDTRTGGAVGEGYLSTQLRSATFLRPDPNAGMDHARNPVSGMLLCGFGCNSPNVHGVLHPDPVNVFDRSLLPHIEFCRLKPAYGEGQLSTEWI